MLRQAQHDDSLENSGIPKLSFRAKSRNLDLGNSPSRLQNVDVAAAACMILALLLLNTGCGRSESPPADAAKKEPSSPSVAASEPAARPSPAPAPTIPAPEVPKDAPVLRDVYPTLASGALRLGRLTDLPDNVLLQTEGVSITESDLQGELTQSPAETREEMRKNAFFLLEQKATMELLTALAQQRIGNASLPRDQVLQRYFEDITRNVSVTDADVATFHEENRGLVGNPPLESIALASPTGKAADKMRQSIESHLHAITNPGKADSRLAGACPPSSTLHRLLGYSPGQDRFWHNEHNLLAEQLIIVDESSMIDLAMMDRLLRAMRPEARLILLGDADQLPSIDAGAVLRDLCQAGLTNERGRVGKLKKSYRAREEDSSGKRILAVAAAINKGSSPETSGGDGSVDYEAMAVRNQISELRFAGVEHLLPGDEAQRLAFYAKWRDRLRESLPGLDERLSKVYISGPSGFDAETIDALRIILAHYERFRILCVTRVTAGGTGSTAVNDWFHRQWLDDLHRKGESIVNANFLVGEPVLVTRNNYNLRLYNGDSGLVLRVATAGETRHRSAEPMAVFPRGGGFVAFPLEALRGRLDLAWATTVHKAQGSEYEDVAIILPEVHLRPLTRELLYTAVTRAKNSVVIIGPEEVLASGITRSMDRASGLTDALTLSRGRGC